VSIRKDSNIRKTTWQEFIHTFLENITLNINGFNSSIKKHRLTIWFKKTRSNCLLSARNRSQWQWQTHTGSERSESGIPSKQNLETWRSSLLNKVDLKPKFVRRDKEGH
jgi:hypothetical protein